MKRDLRSYLFIGSAFLLGSANALYGIGFYIYLVVAFLINISFDPKGFWANTKKETKYLILPLAGALYLLVHYAFSVVTGAYSGYRTNWGMVELLVLYFFFIPLYILSAKNFVTPQLLKRFIFSLCWGILLFNFTKLFYITGISLFTDTVTTLNQLYITRFGGNVGFLGGFVYLEPQAIYLSVSAIFSYFFILRAINSYENKRILIYSIIIFLFSILFLSFTVTKGAILAFVAGFVLLTILYFKELSHKVRIVFASSVLIFVICSYLLMFDAFEGRVREMNVEIENIQDGKFEGTSVAPRLGIIKESFSHFKEFGLLGLGVYKKPIVAEWYKNSPFEIGELTNAHNFLLEFWLVGGIGGVALVLYLFWLPLREMIKRKKYSFLILAILLALFIANNTCILIILVDSSPLVLFMLSMSYLYYEQFVELDVRHKNVLQE